MMADEKKIQVPTIQAARAPRGAAPWLLAWALLLSGCTTTVTRDSQLPTEPLISSNNNNDSKPKPVLIKSTPEEIGDATDPCPMRLQNMTGAFHRYSMSHKDLPERLEDLLPLVASDEPFDLVCPASRRPYVYLRQGLLNPEGNLRLIVYDATPSHLFTVKDRDGRPKRMPVRWGIVRTLPRGNVAPAMDVVHLTEAQFRTYAPDPMEILTPPASGAAVPLGGR